MTATLTTSAPARARARARLFASLAALLAFAAPAAAQIVADSTTADSAAADTITPPDSRRHPSPPSTLGAASRHVVLGFSSDLWATAASPFRMDADEALVVGGAVGTVVLLAVFDEDIQRWVARHRDDDVPAAVEDVGHFLEPVSLMGNTNAYWAGGIAIGWVTGQDEVRHIFEELLYSHWIASLTRKSLGRSLGRLRPEESPEDAFARQFWVGTSFPSGHASTAAQVAAVLAHHIDGHVDDVVLYSLAGTVVYQRVAVQKHWASDSVLGALWGLGVARLVIARREADRTDFVPFFDPGAGAVGFRVVTPF